MDPTSSIDVSTIDSTSKINSTTSTITNPPSSSQITQKILKKKVFKPGENSYDTPSSRKKRQREDFPITIVGRIESMYRQKFGCPRQPGLVTSWSKIQVGNPDLIKGLTEFSHVWLIWIFHLNNNIDQPKRTRIKPPRLNGDTVGVFASRTPHRPNPIGLSLVKLEKCVMKHPASIYVSGADLVDGTPILDIKPFVPYSDQPLGSISTPKWLPGPPKQDLSVEFDPKLNLLLEAIEKSYPNFQQSVQESLALDPRPFFHKGQNRNDNSPKKLEYYICLFDFNIGFRLKNNTEKLFWVYDIDASNAIGSRFLTNFSHSKNTTLQTLKTST